MAPAVGEFAEEPYTSNTELLGQFFLRVAGQIVSSIIATICAMGIRFPMLALAFAYRPERILENRSERASDEESPESCAKLREVEALVEPPGCFSRAVRGPGGKTSQRAVRIQAAVVDTVFYCITFLIGAGCIFYLILMSSYFTNQEETLKVDGLSVSFP
jgi:hypothetical protein